MISINQAATFIQTIFEPEDLIEFRPIETWTQGARKESRVDYRGVRFERFSLRSGSGSWVWWPNKAESAIAEMTARAEAERTNVFFGVCPRLGGDQRFSQSWQIRIIRVLQADVDDCSPDEALQRCTAAGLPAPTIVVKSGHGVHLYWKLAEPYRIDDVDDPQPVESEWLEKLDGGKSRKEFIVDHTTGERLYLAARQNVPKLSPKAAAIQDIQAGIAEKIGGDHTHDLARILRVPGTMNRKDQRNGRAPVACELVDCDPGRLYALELFESFRSSGQRQREQIRQIPLPRRQRMSGKRQDLLNSLLVDCAAADVGRRSEADFAFCCKAVETGLDREEAWTMASGVGKFAERGEGYFDLTWTAATEHAQEQIFNRARAKQIDRAAAKAEAEEGKASGRPEIIVDVDEPRVNDEAIQALAGKPIFQRGGSLVQIVRDADPPRGVSRPKDSPRIAAVRPARLRELLAASADWVKPAGEGEFVPCHPPDWCVKAIEARGQWSEIRPLEGVVEWPALRRDGSVVQTPGYDPASGLLYEPQIEFPPIPENPGRAEALQATATLLDVVCDFCFEKPVHRAAWLAAVLTPFARFAFHGPAPLNLIDANNRGAGKSLLADVTAAIISGRDMARATAPSDDTEFRKLVTSLAICGEPFILLDNVAGTLGSPAFDAALTATAWSDRVLGKSEMVCGVPLRATWYATGNNAILLADTARRSLHIRLKTNEEKPEERSGFKYPRLLEWVKEHRPHLVKAAITVLRAYCLAGRPDMRLRPWGAYEAWSDLIRQAIVWVDMPDPGDTRQELATQAEFEAAAWRRLIDGWEQKDPDGSGMTVSDILREVESYQNPKTQIPMPEDLKKIHDALVELAPSKGGKSLNARSIGMKFLHVRQKVIDGRYMEKREDKLGNLWFVRKVDSQDNQDSQDQGGTRDTRGTKPQYPVGKQELPNNGKYACAGETIGNSPASPSSPPATHGANGSGGKSSCTCDGEKYEIAAGGKIFIACKRCHKKISWRPAEVQEVEYVS
jgi:hypothetical protein